MPHRENKLGITVRIFWRVVDFAGAVALKIPDLTSCDFLLWSHLKGCVHSNNPHSTEEIKNKKTLKMQFKISVTTAVTGWHAT
jgi:hypothetical protein